jgi:hypothetical protein
MKLLKDLALALVNATVLLLIVLGIVVLMLIDRTDDLAQDVITALAPVEDNLETIATAVEKIEADLDTAIDGEGAAALTAEIAALRADIAALRAPMEAAGGLTAEGVVTALLARLATAP